MSASIQVVALWQILNESDVLRNKIVKNVFIWHGIMLINLIYIFLIETLQIFHFELLWLIHITLGYVFYKSILLKFNIGAV